MGRDNTSHRGEPEDMVAVLTVKGRVARVPGPGRVSLFRPCAIAPTGVTLYRWPMRSIFIPLERVDRFGVELRVSPDPGDPGVEHLVLMTRDGKKLPVQGQIVINWRHESYGRPPRSRAQQLNNHICRRPGEDA
jgi:catechol 2,3-dioxygenase-like lactoylglutathione lyase family enzyme